MSILIGADIVPTESNQVDFCQGKAEQMLGLELLKIIKSADHCILNLEVPLVNDPSPIEKNGPNLIAPVNCINGFKAIGVDLLTLANNHIMDQGEHGLISTIHTLDKAGISHVGADKNLKEACAPFFFTVKGKKYGVYACAEHEFSIADEETPGANPFDPLESLDHVTKMKTQCDYVIVLYHGGKEYYRYPSPNLQKICRKFVEKGADLVICQHSHCIGCEEKYLTSTIIYGQGNFIFDHGDDEFWNTSLLVCIEDDGTINYLPLKKCGNCIRKATDDEAEEILEGYIERSKEILKPNFIENYYTSFAKKAIDSYMIAFSGKSSFFPFRVANKITGHKLQKLSAERYKKRMNLQIRNYIECEAHRELLLKGLQN